MTPRARNLLNKNLKLNRPAPLINTFYKNPETASFKNEKYELKSNEDFIEYKYYEQPDGSTKRMKLVRKTAKYTKYLTEEHVEEIINAFKLFDKDKSNSIDLNELKDAMKALGIHLKKVQVKKLMGKADKDGSGAIDQ